MIFSPLYKKLNISFLQKTSFYFRKDVFYIFIFLWYQKWDVGGIIQASIEFIHPHLLLSGMIEGLQSEFMVNDLEFPRSKLLTQPDEFIFDLIAYSRIILFKIGRKTELSKEIFDGIWEKYIHKKREKKV